MTWKEFKDMVDFLLEEQGVEDNVPILNIDINWNDSVKTVRVSILNGELVVV
jgi:hypothetical protein